MIRVFEKKDIPKVADLYNRMLLSEFPSKRQLAITELHRYFEDTFFENPWYAADMPSLLYEGKDGNLAGFLGVVPRNMIFAGKPIRMAIILHFIVDPDSRAAFAGLQLLKDHFAGPQDLSYTDGAGEDGRKVWVAVGGAEVPLLALNWSRVIKPGRHTVDYLNKRFNKNKVLSIFVSTLNPVSVVADRTFQRILPNHFPSGHNELIEEDLDIDTMLELLPQFSKSYSLHPSYDKNGLSWALNNAEQIKEVGELKKKVVRDNSGTALGYYLYYLNRSGSSPVIHIAAKKGFMTNVLDSLFNSASRDGASVLTGRILPNFISEMSAKRCNFSAGNYTLAQSRNSELLHAIQRGDAFLSDLEGEWCQMF